MIWATAIRVAVDRVAEAIRADAAMQAAAAIRAAVVNVLAAVIQA